MSPTRVWEPIRIGSLEIKNRVVRAANTTTMFPDSVNDDFVAYHLARARGGGNSLLNCFVYGRTAGRNAATQALACVD